MPTRQWRIKAISMGNLVSYAPISGEAQSVFTVSAGARVTKAAWIMVENGIGSLVVVNEFHEVVGIVTERDILRWTSAATPESHFAKVSDIMSDEVITCGPDAPLEEAHRIMAQHRIRHLPVVDDGKPVGMISVRDVLNGSIETET